jgi:hypothetical protein
MYSLYPLHCAGEFVHCMGDTHVYLNHVEPLKEQLQRTPRAFPTLTIKRDVDNIEVRYVCMCVCVCVLSFAHASLLLAPTHAWFIGLGV